MTQGYIGERERHSWGEQSDYDTETTTTNVFGIDTVFQPSFSQGFERVLNNGSDTRTVKGHVLGATNFEFTQEFSVTEWEWLKFFFDFTNTDNGDGTFTHTLTVPDTPRFFTHQRHRGHSTEAYTENLIGAFLYQLQLSARSTTPDGENAKIQVTTQGNAKTNNTGVSKDTISTLPAENDVFTFDEYQFSLAGTEYDRVKSTQLTFNQGFREEDSRYASANAGRSLGEPFFTLFTISGETVINAVDSTFFDTYNAGNAVSTTHVFEKSSGNKLTIELADCRVTSGNNPTTYEGIEPVNIQYDGTSFTTLEVVDDREW